MADPSEAFGRLRISTRDTPVKCRTVYLSGVGLDMAGPGKTSVTDGKASFMAIPPEIRLKIYYHLLIVNKSITLSVSQRAKGTRPSAAILRTCRTINREGTPILYGMNHFTVFLDLTPGPAYLVCFPMSLRWSSIRHIEAIDYKSKTMALSSFDAKFPVSGNEIIERFTAREIRYSPVAPDNYLALSIKDWVSREIVQATMTAFHNSMSAAIMGHIPLP